MKKKEKRKEENRDKKFSLFIKTDGKRCFEDLNCIKRIEEIDDDKTAIYFGHSPKTGEAAYVIHVAEPIASIWLLMNRYRIPGFEFTPCPIAHKAMSEEGKTKSTAEAKLVFGQRAEEPKEESDKKTDTLKDEGVKLDGDDV